MVDILKLNRLKNALQDVRARVSRKEGSILVYIIVVMLIFAVLGAAMLSLFSTSIGSSATANESRRAMYLAEAGLRYGLSELRKENGFSTTNIATLNNTEYKMPPSGAFDVTVFGAWFKSPTNQSVAGGTLSVEIDKGKIPPSFFEKTLPEAISDLYLVVASLDPRSATQKPNPAEVAKPNAFSYTVGNDTSFTFTLADDFVIGKDKDICMAIKPASARIFSPSGDSDAYLYLKPGAGKIFPKMDGSFQFTGRTFFYKTATQESNGSIKINNISSASSAQVDVQESDYILLTPNNYFVTSKGTYGQVSFGGDLDNSASLSDHSFHSEKEIILTVNDFSQIESDPKFIGGDGENLRIGEKTNLLNAALGAMWFNQSVYLGGATDYGNNGRVLFGRGIRAFFTLEYTGSGDGFVFSLINGNPNKNDTASAGGDIERSEMLGYAGDSRLNPEGTLFLDNSGPARGLIAPKIGLEFDTKVNYSPAFETTGAYCASATSLNENTRNDPGTPAADNRDAVQFVYWGADALKVPCRANDPSYDDNRHDAFGAGDPNWVFDTGGAIQSSPLIAGNGTIYVGSNSTNFFAVNPDGTEKWRVNSSGPWYSPSVSGSGRIYVGTGASENKLFAIRDDGNAGVVLWSFPSGGAGGPVTTKPAVGTTGNSSGIIYFGSDDGALRAVNSSGTQVWRFDVPGLPGPPNPIRSSPALSTGGNTVYFGTNNGRFYARGADNGDLVWAAFIGSAFNSSPIVGRRAGDVDDTVYVGNDDGHLYAFNGSTGAERWSYQTGEFTRSSPALNADGSVVYIGSSNGILFAVNTSDGSERWRFTGASGAIESSITVDANGHIYFGSNDNKVYALYSDGIEKWNFTTGDDVVANPAVRGDGTVYAGSKDGKLYAITQFANPKNRKDLLITSAGQSVGGVPVALTSENDWLKGSSLRGPWSVRLEITRTPSESSVPGVYNLRAWVRQCNQADCSDVLGTFFEDTRVNYSPSSPTARPPMIEQTINLDSSNHTDFERFIFGFTAQTGASETQTATIRKLHLSFIRPNDPTVDSDPEWP